MIERIIVRNYRRLRELNVELLPGMNIVVGQNGTGKSTLIEAINLALTGRLNGRPFMQELTPYLVNMEATTEYVLALRNGERDPPPEILVELYVTDLADAEILRGTNNSLALDRCGLRIRSLLNDDFAEEYANFAADVESIKLAPTEYYRLEWTGFSGNSVTSRSVPIGSSLIDPATLRPSAGIDHHLQHIVETHLDANERVELSRQYRNVREAFAQHDAVKRVNTKLRGDSPELTDRELTLGMDISQRYTWESSLVAHLNDIPFAFVGKGEQSAVKTLLAINQRADTAHVVLIEEPENNLSHTSLRSLLERIENQCVDKQVVVATHSTVVLNKLGLDHLLLLSDDGCVRLTELPFDTVQYFKKLAGYDTLRLVLADAAILVEGPSDELIVQRAYLDAKGKLPIADRIDVISVGLSHKRFLDIAILLGRQVAVVTDNDGKSVEEVSDRFKDYLGYDCVTLHTGLDPSLKTLEPQIVAVNDLATLNAALGRTFESKEQLAKWMEEDKPAAALAIFESETRITMPRYILDSIGE